MFTTSGPVSHDAERNGFARLFNSSSVLRIHLLGGFVVAAGDAELAGSAWRNRKAAQLVKSLALAPDHALHREQCHEMLWPEHTQRAASNNLRQTLHIARHLLQTLPIDSAALLRIRNERVHLYPADCLWIDVEAFGSAARAALRTKDPAMYWAGIDLYGGPLLPDDLYDDWVSSRREALSATYLTLLDDVADVHEARGEYSQAASALQRIIELEPADEAAHVRLMRLYTRTGHRSLALRQYQQLVFALERDLDTIPDEATTELFEEIKRGSPIPRTPEMIDRCGATPVPESNQWATNLPHTLSSFIGRDREVEELSRLIAAHRLVTLTGPGGVGKTRLALELGRKLVRCQGGDVWFVDLTALPDATLLVPTVAGALGLQLSERLDPLSALISRLEDRNLLLILDNCEHFVAECAHFVGTLLANCAEVRVLATSREALRLRGGHPWLVAPLPLPERNAGLESIAANDAVRLFIDRTRLHRPDFALTVENAGAITTICRQLDGLPLALELAASRAAVLSLTELEHRLDDALDVLTEGARHTPRRQQTLRATLDWSHELLEPSEQILFRRLSAFTGGWTLDAAEAICPDDELPSSAILGSLSHLVQKSLVAVDTSGNEARYRLLEPVRQYATERLRTSGEHDVVRERHARYFLTFAEEAESRLAVSGQSEWLKRVAREQDNVRETLAWFMEREEHAAALRLAAALGRFWWVQGYVAEGQQWLTRTLAATAREPQPARMKALGAAFTMAHRRGDYETAQAMAEERLSLAREQGDVQSVAWSLAYLGMVAVETGDDQPTLFEESLALFREVDDPAGIAEVLNMLGEVKRRQGDFTNATRRYEESLALWRELGNEQYVAMILHNLGRVVQRQGAFQRAATVLVDSLGRFEELRISNGVALCLRGLAGVAVGIGRLEAATRFLGAAETLAERAGVVEDVADREQTESAIAAARAGLGAAQFDAIWAASQRRSPEVAMAEALTFADARLYADPIAALTPREQMVARLVARRLTNPQIAAELGTSERTIDTHVSRILHKLGIASRHDIAARFGDLGDTAP